MIMMMSARREAKTLSEDAAATVEDVEVAEASALPLDPLSPASSLPSDLAASVSPEMKEGKYG